MQHLFQIENPAWLLFLYALPARSSTQRVYVWRKLKGAGVVYLRESVCVLPDAPDNRNALEDLRAEIVERGGEASVSPITFGDEAEAAGLMEKFRRQADEEYVEFLGQCRDFHAELAEERREKHFTFAEFEENDAELSKLRSWLKKAKARDFFTGAKAAEADKALAACEQDMERFGREVERAESAAVTKEGKSSKVSTRPKAGKVTEGRKPKRVR